LIKFVNPLGGVGSLSLSIIYHTQKNSETKIVHFLCCNATTKQKSQVLNVIVFLGLLLSLAVDG
jgi:hypothetical protein